LSGIQLMAFFVQRRVQPCWCQVDVGECSWCRSFFLIISPATAPEN
jgi:hypothetical protein